MYLFHISDLHLGKQLHGYSLLEEQRDILNQIYLAATEKKPEALLICGDIYDRSIPSGEAMSLFDEFLGKLSSLSNKPAILVIAGNHDSPERLRYGKDFLAAHSIYISVMPPQSQEEKLERVVLEDEFGSVNFYLLPFLRPGMVRHYMPEEAAAGETEIIRKLLQREKIDVSQRNVLLSHQFYQNGSQLPEISDSEQLRVNVGGLDGVSLEIVTDFDYVALGHIHKPQFMDGEHIRYSGTPLPYSVSEAGQNKSITMVKLGDKAEGIEISTIPLKPLRGIQSLRGTMEELTKKAQQGVVRDYVSITLTQEELPEQPRYLLEPYYENILEILVDNLRSSYMLEEPAADYQQLSPQQSFEYFFMETQGREMTEEEQNLLREIIEEIED